MTRFDRKADVVVGRPGGARLAHYPRQKTNVRRYKRQRPSVSVTPDYLRNLGLNERDRSLVRYLGEIGYATTGQIARLFFADLAHPLKNAQRRLTAMWRWHVLDRTPGTGLERYGLPVQLVYAPGEAGLLMLSEGDPEGAKLRKRRGTGLLHHNVLLGEALTRLSEAGYDLTFYGERGTYTRFQWNERYVRMRPDGLLFLQRAEGEFPMFLELDTGMREVDTFTAKIFQYELYFNSGAWKASYSRFPAVGVIVWASGKDDDQRIRKSHRRLERIVEHVRTQRKAKDSLTWLFATLDRVADTWYTPEKREIGLLERQKAD